MYRRARIRIIPRNRVDQCFATDSEECERKLAKGIVSSRIGFPLSRRIIDCRGSSPQFRDRVVIVSCNSILHSFTSRKWEQTRMILSIMFSKLYKEKDLYFILLLRENFKPYWEEFNIKLILKISRKTDF